jgi:hypothetical protein
MPTTRHRLRFDGPVEFRSRSVARLESRGSDPSQAAQTSDMRPSQTIPSSSVNHLGPAVLQGGPITYKKQKGGLLFAHLLELDQERRKRLGCFHNFEMLTGSQLELSGQIHRETYLFSDPESGENHDQSGQKMLGHRQVKNGLDCPGKSLGTTDNSHRQRGPVRDAGLAWPRFRRQSEGRRPVSLTDALSPNPDRATSVRCPRPPGPNADVLGARRCHGERTGDCGWLTLSTCTARPETLRSGVRRSTAILSGPMGSC